MQDLFFAFGVLSSITCAMVLPVLMAIAFNPLWLLLYLFYAIVFIVMCSAATDAQDQSPEREERIKATQEENEEKRRS